MKRILPIALLSLGASLFSCTPAPRETAEATPASVPAENERLWLAPLVNTTRVEDLEGWPRDSLEKSILVRHFAAIRDKLLSEFRRCEKYGLYKMTDDSAGATMRLFITLDGYTKAKDTLTMPIDLHVASLTHTAGYDFTFFARAGGVTRKPGANPFHYAGDLTAELCSSFPYRDIVYRFYSQAK
jgi:hypothetical protein